MTIVSTVHRLRSERLCRKAEDCQTVFPFFPSRFLLQTAATASEQRRFDVVARGAKRRGWRLGHLFEVVSCGLREVDELLCQDAPHYLIMACCRVSTRVETSKPRPSVFNSVFEIDLRSSGGNVSLGKMGYGSDRESESGNRSRRMTWR